MLGTNLTKVYLRYEGCFKHIRSKILSLDTVRLVVSTNIVVIAVLNGAIDQAMNILAAAILMCVVRTRIGVHILSPS